MKGLFFTVILMTLFILTDAQESAKKSSKLCKEEKQAEQIKKVKELVENQTFAFSVRQAVPLCGDPVSLDYLYSLKIDNGYTNSHLPFYGFESDYNIENSPIDFKKPYENYSIKKEKNNYVVNFNVPGENDDNMKFYLRISELGYAYLKISSDQRQCISFQGMIEEVKPTVFSSF